MTVIIKIYCCVFKQSVGGNTVNSSLRVYICTYLLLIIAREDASGNYIRGLKSLLEPKS